jgi:pyridinium-3,5-biscarboxylic acid mononucleotide sulfurtransferase
MIQTAVSPMSDLAPDLREKYDRLITLFEAMGSVLIGFSGGVDSTLIARAAYDALGDRALAVTGISPSLMIEEANECPKIAAHIGIPYLEIRTEEMEDLNYVSNPVNRCYFCKSELWDKLLPIARERGYAAVVDGSNVDDLGDFRPGMEAGKERDIRSPLQEAGLTKADIRAISNALGLPTWNKPSHPCLSSRIPHGTFITIEKLDQVGQAEAYLRVLGFRGFRVRHHGEIARLELPLAEFPKALEHRAEIVDALTDIGFKFVTLDLAGFRSGSLNPTTLPHGNAAQ